MTFPIESTTPALYRFRLKTDNQDIICDPEPLEWKSGQLEINRDLKLGGVFTTFQLNSLTFIGNGGKLLSDLFNLFEVNAKCDLVVEWFNYQLREYVEFPSRFNINFCFYEKVKVGRKSIGIKVKAINSDTQTKLDSRSDIDVDLNKLVSIGGKAITDYTALKKQIDYNAVNIYNYAQFSSAKHNNYPVPRLSGMVSYCMLPLNVSASDFKESNSVKYATKFNYDTTINPFFKNAIFDYELEINYDFLFYVNKKHMGTQPWDVYILQTNKDGDSTELFIGSFGNDTGIADFHSSMTVKLEKGDSLRLVVRVRDIENIDAYAYYSNIEITQKIIQSPEKTTEGFPIYEATERVLQHILDIQYPLYSDYFGRTDVAYNSNGSKYTQEDQRRFAHIQTGLNLRGVKLNGSESFPLNFEKLRKGMQAIWNIGYSLEKFENEINERVRIEPYSYFFKNEMALDLSQRICPDDIVSAVMPELIPVSIKSGFDNYEYLEINGRAEPNTTSERTSEMNTDAKFECISPLRGDTKGIYSALSAEYDTKDTKGDNKVFIIKSQRAGVKIPVLGLGYVESPAKTRWKPERGENITIEDSTSIFKNDLLNRYFTPSRMLKRSGNRIKAGMIKFPTSYLRFQTSEKLQTLKTTGTLQSGDDQYTITENDDIPVSSLANPIYRPIKHTVSCSFDFTDLNMLMLNKYGYIKFSDSISGYLLYFKKKNNESKAEITIIERHVS